MEARILIVEDEALIALHLEQIVSDAGHRVVGIAFDPAEAAALAAKHRPDFAFVDMRLRHGGSGLDVARHLRDMYGMSSILVSGNLDVRSAEAAASLMPVAMIGKPFMPSTILGAIDLAVRRLDGSTRRRSGLFGA
ncbi:MAG: response regulator [Xanthomonadaceae bacterium]|nr:response regulator [Xanthomonadaceae bacterium]